VSNPVLPFDVLIELLRYSFEPWGSSGRYPATPPTPKSIEHIHRETGVVIPELLVRVAEACPSYGGWFGSIGEDYGSGNHLLQHNWHWHNVGLPSRYVIFNHGHDGDCDCWDTSGQFAGEYPIMYVQMTDMGSVRFVQPWASSIQEYLDRHAREHGPRCAVKTLRRRAKRLLAAHTNT